MTFHDTPGGSRQPRPGRRLPNEATGSNGASGSSPEKFRAVRRPEARILA